MVRGFDMNQIVRGALVFMPYTGGMDRCKHLHGLLIHLVIIRRSHLGFRTSVSANSQSTRQTTAESSLRSLPLILAFAFKCLDSLYSQVTSEQFSRIQFYLDHFLWNIGFCCAVS